MKVPEASDTPDMPDLYRISCPSSRRALGASARLVVPASPPSCHPPPRPFSTYWSSDIECFPPYCHSPPPPIWERGRSRTGSACTAAREPMHEKDRLFEDSAYILARRQPSSFDDSTLLTNFAGSQKLVQWRVTTCAEIGWRVLSRRVDKTTHWRS